MKTTKTVKAQTAPAKSKESIPVEGEYNGKPTLTLYPEIEWNKAKLTLGLEKARKILKKLKYVEAFVAKYPEKEPKKGEAAED